VVWGTAGGGEIKALKVREERGRFGLAACIALHGWAGWLDMFLRASSALVLYE